MFVTLSVAAMLSMAANAGDTMEQARISFNNCIVDSTVENLGRKATESSFSATIKTACQAQSKAYHAAIMKNEQSDGATKKEAEEYAAEEVQMMLDDSVVNYADHLQANSVPVKEG